VNRSSLENEIPMK